jgi:hypothetical protein
MAYIYTSPRIGGQPIGTVEVSAQHALGTVITARDNSGNGGEATFIYVQASASISQYDAIAIKGSYKAAQLTITNAKLQIEIGFSQVAVGTKDSYFWAMQGGRPIVKMALATQAAVPLFASATGGVLTSVSTSVVIQGVQAITEVTNSAGSNTCVARFPTAHHEPPG